MSKPGEKMMNRSSLIAALQSLAVDRSHAYSDEIEEESFGSWEDGILSLGISSSLSSASTSDSAIFDKLSNRERNFFSSKSPFVSTDSQQKSKNFGGCPGTQRSSSDKLRLANSKNKTNFELLSLKYMNHEKSNGRLESQRSASEKSLLSRNGRNERMLTRSMSAFSLSSQQIERDICPSIPVRCLSPAKKQEKLGLLPDSKRPVRHLPDKLDRNVTATNFRQRKSQDIMRQQANTLLCSKTTRSSKSALTNNTSRCRKSTNNKQFIFDRKEHAYHCFQGLYDLKSKNVDSDDSDNSDISKEIAPHDLSANRMTERTHIRCSIKTFMSMEQPLSACNSSIVPSAPLGSNDQNVSSIRWQNSQETTKNISLRLPTRHVSPRKHDLNTHTKEFHSDMLKVPEAQKQKYSSTFLILAESPPDHTYLKNPSAFAA